MTELAGEPAGRLGATHPEAPNAFVDSASRASTEVHTLHFVQRFVFWRERTSSMNEPHWFFGCSIIRLPAATTLHAATRGFCNLSSDTELQILHITILKFERWSLEPKLPDFLRVCSNVLLRSSFQLLHPNSSCNTHRQRTGSTNRVDRQVDSLSPLRVDRIRIQVSSLVAFPLSSSLFLDPFPGLLVTSVVLFKSVDSTHEQTCNLLTRFLTRRLFFLFISPFIKGRRSLLALASFAFAFAFRFGSCWRLGCFRLPSHFLLTVFHHMTGRVTPETVTIKLIRLASFFFSFTAFLASFDLCTFACRNFPIVSLCFSEESRSLHSKMITEDLRTDLLDAHHVY